MPIECTVEDKIKCRFHHRRTTVLRTRRCRTSPVVLAGELTSNGSTVFKLRSFRLRQNGFTVCKKTVQPFT